ncbi:MAG: FAD-dependent oxidoreductase [Clostridia bacterium]|nr:FAD-dependent oxidoreductase [Clostridia bacterium]
MKNVINFGGILEHGIPEFRLEKEVLNKTINSILNIGIEVKVGQELGRNLELGWIQENYDAVFLAFGANIPRKMVIEGEEIPGVYGGNTLLEQNNHPDYINKKVAIIGGGNVAMDSARTIKRLGAQRVVVIYRRSEEEMPAEVKEIEDAKKEGIEFLFQTNITKVLGKEKVEKIECIKTQLIQKEGETRKVPVDIENSNFEMDMNYVIMCVGSKVEKEVLESQNLPSTKKKYLEVNEKNQVEGTNIFAGGDLIGTTATVAWAARSGRDAAQRIEEYLMRH